MSKKQLSRWLMKKDSESILGAAGIWVDVSYTGAFEIKKRRKQVEMQSLAMPRPQKKLELSLV